MSSPANKPTQTTSLKPQRLPAPHLFVGPPSRNASNTSLLSPSTKDGANRPPISRQHSLLGEAPRTSRTTATPKDRNDTPSSTTEPTLSTDRQNPSPIQPQDTGSFLRDRGKATGPPLQKTQEQPNERADALWAEMQSTLAEVELSASASGGGMNAIFGAGHSKALEGLRVAQVGLAKAWARSEGEEEKDGPTERETKTGLASADVTSLDRGPVAGSAELGRRRSGTAESGKSLLEEETEMDIALAKKRREANDRYFQRVNKGVLDVVAKLEEVAKAMKAVELESREIWGDKDSVDDNV